MNPDLLEAHLEDPFRGYLQRMLRAPGQRRTLDLAVDAAVVLVAGTLSALAAWGASDPVGAQVAGPTWLVALIPFLWALPLWWRRSRPLLAWSVVMAALVVQALVSGNSPEGLELIFVFSVGMYSVGAYSTRPRAFAGLGIAALGYAVYALENHDIQTGQAGQLWAGAFFAVELLACWLIGIVVRELRERRAEAARRRDLELATDRALADERARLARELHDIVSHNLSVVVVQAAGARAQGHTADDTLAKIERSGRESLVEMRRLLGVLRHDDPAAPGPQPRLDDVEKLAARVRDAGIGVDVVVSGDRSLLSPALELTAYRVVQEALANVVRHAGPGSRAQVTVDATRERVQIRVVDDGQGAADSPDAGGQGLRGMKERVTLMGGELRTGPLAEGGFEVSVELPTGADS
jgi:signal transduction histidine kinase